MFVHVKLILVAIKVWTEWYRERWQLDDFGSFAKKLLPQNRASLFRIPLVPASFDEKHMLMSRTI